jgi:hypothetical protein
MKRFTDKENARVDFLIKEIKFFSLANGPIPIINEYLNELLVYVILNHPKANDFYYYGE